MKCKLLDLTVDGKGTYGIAASAVDFDSQKPTYLRITDINDDGTINFDGLKSVDDENSYKYILKENDIVFARTGASTGRSYFYQKEDGVFVYAGFLIKFSLDPQKVNPRYLKYYTHSKMYYDWVHSFDSGATRGNINAKTFGDMLLDLPERNVQDEIVSILKDIDDKIAVNRRICENLEAQAQALFKHWFIDFAPFLDKPSGKAERKNGKFVESELGMIPEGWRVNPLGEMCKCELGGTPSRANKSYWGGNISWINSGEINKFRICEASEYITEEGLNHSATKLLPAKTTVLAITGATLGQVSLLEIDSCANQSVVGVKENSKVPYTFIYPAIKSKIKELVNMQTGGAQQHINKDNIQSLRITIPPQNIMEEYKSVTIPMYNEIGNLCFENLRLSTLRDTLLPKLMSGQIKI